MSLERLQQEIASLRRRVDDIEAALNPKSGKTTKAQRKALHSHIQGLEESIKLIKEKKKAEPPPNTFKLNQYVQLIKDAPNREKGFVKFMTCKECKDTTKKEGKRINCDHEKKNYLWVQWANGKTFIYRYTELKPMDLDELKPRIGRELSGRIGPWTYNADTERWKKDGEDKEYTNAEFDQILFEYDHADEVEEGKKFVHQLLKEKQAK